MEVLSKQQLRIQETQSRLLDAAEEVFVRDGYEGAQLDEIAAVAGRSKGAVYNHFKNKEDLFLALFEHRTRSYIQRLMESLQKCTTRQQNLKAFREFFVRLAEDKTWPILTLEFKLYALRHPESKVRLRKAFEMSKATSDASHYEQLFGQLSRSSKADNDLALVALGPLAAGLILESNFEPEILTDKGLRRLLGRFFDSLFPATP
jgi:AcrR family transcriptional regulator